MFDNFVIYARRITLSLITLRIKQQEQFHLAQTPQTALCEHLHNVKTDARVHFPGKVQANRIFIRSSLPN